MIKQAEGQNNPKVIQDLENEIGVITQNVEQTEDIVLKIEAEILEWNAFKKLCKRDKELYDVKNMQSDLQIKVDADIMQMNGEIQVNQQRMQEIEDADELRELTIAVNEFKNGMIEVQENIIEQVSERELCFSEFDSQIP